MVLAVDVLTPAASGSLASTEGLGVIIPLHHGRGDDIEGYVPLSRINIFEQVRKTYEGIPQLADELSLGEINSVQVAIRTKWGMQQYLVLLNRLWGTDYTLRDCKPLPGPGPMRYAALISGHRRTLAKGHLWEHGCTVCREEYGVETPGGCFQRHFTYGGDLVKVRLYYGITPYRAMEMQCKENVRGADVFIVQPTGPPANHNIMELLIMLDAFKRSSASRVTAVLPYYGYARQDRKDKPRVPITAKLTADLITAAGADRALCIDLHAAQIQGFFNIPVDHLFAAPVLLDAIRDSSLDPLTVVSPDAGGVERARAFAKRLGAGLAIVDKRRKGKNEVEVLHVIGDVKDRNVIVVDDIIDTAGTLINTVIALKDSGARRIFAGCVHAVLSGPAIDRINGSPIERIFCSNTVPLEEKLARCPLLTPLSIAPLLAEAIQRIHQGASVSSLFV